MLVASSGLQVSFNTSEGVRLVLASPRSALAI